MPRPPKPTSVIKFEGNRAHKTKAELAERERREASLRPPIDNVNPPEWLGKIGKREWASIIDGLKQLELVTDLDVTTLAIYCDAVEHYLVERDKESPNPRTLVQWTQVVKGYLGEFGLSPSSRLKLATPKEKEKPKTPFEQAFGDV